MSADHIQRVTQSTKTKSFLWAPWRAKKIRIAILDTGIDVESDTLIKTAIGEGRIKERCGFVNDPDSSPDSCGYQDVNGHGTHVTRLILNAAPSAEILIAKISNGVTMSRQHLHGIAKVNKEYQEEAKMIEGLLIGKSSLGYRMGH